MQRDAQVTIFEVTQGRPSCTRPTFAGSNMRHDDSDMPALGPVTDPLASTPILLQQRRLGVTVGIRAVELGRAGGKDSAPRG